MSFALEQLAWRSALENRFAKILMVYLAYRANADGLCWPSVATISRETGYSSNTVRRALQFLQDEEILTRHQSIVDGAYTNNRYQFSPEFVAKANSAGLGEVPAPARMDSVTAAEPVLPTAMPHIDKQSIQTKTNSQRVWNEEEFEMEWSRFVSCPGFNPHQMPKEAARRARLAVLATLPPTPRITEAIDAYRQDLIRDGGKRAAFMVSPSKWYSELRWQAVSLDEAEQVFQGDLSLLGDAYHLLIEGGLPVAVLSSWFDNAVFEAGPPATFKFTKKAAFSMVPIKYGDLIRKIFGDDVAFLLLKS